MIFDKYIANSTAKNLLKIKAIKLNTKNPFTWASGWKSPIYCDNRIVLSYPLIRNFIKKNITKIIVEKYGKPDIIAGVATGGIAIGVLAAQELKIPFLYVRPKAKKHGRQNQIEGFLRPKSNVIVIEDLVSTGKSSLKAVEILKKEDSNIKGVIAVFNYGFKIADTLFKEAKTDLTTLSDYKHLLEQALEDNYIDKNEIKTLSVWSKSPDTWK